MTWTELHLPYDCGAAAVEVPTKLLEGLAQGEADQVSIEVRAKVSSPTGEFWPTTFSSLQIAGHHVDHVRLVQAGTPESVDIILVLDGEPLTAIMQLRDKRVLQFPPRGQHK